MQLFKNYPCGLMINIDEVIAVDNQTVYLKGGSSIPVDAETAKDIKTDVHTKHLYKFA